MVSKLDANAECGQGDQMILKKNRPSLTKFRPKFRPNNFYHKFDFKISPKFSPNVILN
jgi:hypothetical protein